MTLRELLLNRYAPLHNLSERSVTLYQGSVDRYADFLGREPEVDPADLDDLQVAKFVRWRQVTPHKGRIPKPATVTKDKAQLCSIWSYAAKKRLNNVDFPALPRNLCRVEKHVPVAYRVEEIERLIAVARTRKGVIGGQPAAWWWASLVWAGFTTGERIGGLLGLRWRNVDLEHCRVLYEAHERKGRTRELSRRITPELAAYLAEHRGQPDARVWDWDRHPNSIYASLRILCRRARVEPHGFHGLRKSHGSYVRAGGGNAQDALSHRSASTTNDHYIDPTIARRDEGIDFLPRLRVDGGQEKAPPPASSQDGAQPPERPAA